MVAEGSVQARWAHPLLLWPSPCQMSPESVAKEREMEGENMDPPSVLELTLGAFPYVLTQFLTKPRDFAQFCITL